MFNINVRYYIYWKKFNVNVFILHDLYFTLVAMIFSLFYFI